MVGQVKTGSLLTMGRELGGRALGIRRRSLGDIALPGGARERVEPGNELTWRYQAEPGNELRPYNGPRERYSADYSIFSFFVDFLNFARPVSPDQAQLLL